MDHNPLIPRGREGSALTLSSRPSAAYTLTRSAPASVGRRVLVGLFRGLHYLLFAVVLWLHVPLLWACDVIGRLAIFGTISSALFWSLSTKPVPIVVQTAWVCIGVNFACHLLVWLYERLLILLSPNRR